MSYKKKIDDGGPAYPYCVWYGDHHQGHNGGLSKREAVAMAAMQSLIPLFSNGQLEMKDCRKITEETVCEQAFYFADAFLERGKR